MSIDEPPKAATPFDTLGGESQVLALAERFYDLMDLEPAYAALRAAHGSTRLKSLRYDSAIAMPLVAGA